METKTKGQLLADELCLNRKHASEILSEKEIAKADEFCEGYKKFLDNAKTEREAVSTTISMLKEHGYVEFVPGTKYVAGDKVYMNNRGKALVFAVVGTKPLTEGARILASHIDSPCIDLKPNPLYENNELTLLKTHYYGGIRKYQWVTLPLSLHGVIVKKDGTKITVAIGDKDDEPIFYITDLLPHLSKDQNERKLKDGITGEELNVLVGSRPFNDDKASNKIKLNILNILNQKYGMIEADFLSADLHLVPASNARDLGFDRSMIAAYGHDDRVCAYTSIMASIENDKPTETWINILADREEIGSTGPTGMQAAYLDYFVADLAKPHGIESRTVFSKSKCLSADVSAAFDPTFPEVSEINNTSFLNKGVVMIKYTGSGGKNGTNEATAEYMQFIRKYLDDKNIVWQTGELGKVDQGGGGTVARYIGELGVDTVDLGVPVLSMHAPVEVVAKLDVYETYRAFSEFIRA
ncbi:MAG: aminopeptidase [Oscillospiraceae bacterium]